MATLLERSRTAVFPAAEVEACIRDALLDHAADQAVLHPNPGVGTAVPIAPSSWEPEIDSLVAVEVICAIEELLGIEISPTSAPRGGYDSTEACLNDLMSEAKAAWDAVTKERESHEE
jgi:acyl carrier protein